MNTTITILLQIGLAVLWFGIGYMWGEIKAKREFSIEIDKMMNAMLEDLSKSASIEITKITKKKASKK